MKKLWEGIKKKGFKATILKIPTRRTPVQIEHNMRSEFQRARVIRTLNRTRQFLGSVEASGWSSEGEQASYLIMEITALIRELESYEK